jgi:hypothetical protein
MRPGALAQLIEQPGVLDGDDRLRGEVLDQLDLLVEERPHLLAIDDDGPDQLIILEHGHDDRRPRSTELDRVAGIRLGRVVGAVDHLSRPQDAIVERPRLRAKGPAPPLEFDQCRRRAGRGCRVQGIAVVTEQRTELGVANADRVLQHHTEDRLQLAGRRADDLQDLGGQKNNLLQALAGEAQPGAQQLDQLERDLRLGVNKGEKVPPVDRHQLAIRHGDGIGGARLAIEERDLAEHVAFIQQIEHRLASAG